MDELEPWFEWRVSNFLGEIPQLDHFHFHVIFKVNYISKITHCSWVTLESWLIKAELVMTWIIKSNDSSIHKFKDWQVEQCYKKKVTEPLIQLEPTSAKSILTPKSHVSIHFDYFGQWTLKMNWFFTVKNWFMHHVLRYMTRTFQEWSQP